MNRKVQIFLFWLGCAIVGLSGFPELSWGLLRILGLVLVVVFHPDAYWGSKENVRNCK